MAIKQEGIGKYIIQKTLTVISKINASWTSCLEGFHVVSTILLTNISYNRQHNISHKKNFITFLSETEQIRLTQCKQS